MLTEKQLTDAFEVYWWEMDQCRRHKTYWALLHVVVCMPDICAALRAPKAGVRSRYIAWCKDSLEKGILSPNDRWTIRKKVLHEGRSTTDKWRFEFWQPSPRTPKHGTQEGTTLHLNVDDLTHEMQEAIRKWIKAVVADKTENDLVAKNLDTLVRVQRPADTAADPTRMVPMPNLSTASGR